MKNNIKKYYIYHVPGVKIGCSTEPNYRVKRQGYDKYEILETHTDIDIASQREIELQNQYGYYEIYNNTNYIQHYEFAKKGRNNSLGMGAKSQIENKIGIWSLSKEERASIRAKATEFAKLKNSTIVYQLDINENFIKKYSSIREAARETNISVYKIRRCLKSKSNIADGFIWKKYLKNVE
jgi:hypothetical protein